MRERITFIVSDPKGTHPDNYDVTQNSLTIKSLPQAAREDKLTIDVRALPKRIQDLFKEVKEAQLRWSSGRFYRNVSPYGSRVPAGLHIFTKPRWLNARHIFPQDHHTEWSEWSEDWRNDDFLKTAFGLSFPVSERLSPGIFKIGAWPNTYYSPVESLAPFRAFLQKLLVWHHGLLNVDSIEWMKRLEKLEEADSVDLKYDAISGKFEASIYYGPSERAWSETLKGRGDVEVGVMGVEKGVEEDDIQLAGFIYEIGDSDHLEPTMFSFPSRHHRTLQTFTLTTPLPTGLHPRLQLSLPGPHTPPREDVPCTLYSYFTLPSALFVDKYQLDTSNMNLLSSLNIKQVRVTGNTDLEQPNYTIQEWGSRVLIQIDTTSAKDNIPLQMELPLHLRYLSPLDGASSTNVTFAWPAVFWACSSDNWVKMSNSPFDRTALGWEDLLVEQTMYYHLSPAPAPGMEGSGTFGRIEVPVLDKGWGNEEVIKTGTTAVVGLGFLWAVGKVVMAKVRGTKVREGVKKE